MSCSLSPPARPAGLPPAGRWWLWAAGCSHPWRWGCREHTDPPRWRRGQQAVVCSVCPPSSGSTLSMPQGAVAPPRHSCCHCRCLSRPCCPCDAQPPPRGPCPPALGAEAADSWCCTHQGRQRCGSWGLGGHFTPHGMEGTAQPWDGWGGPEVPPGAASVELVRSPKMGAGVSSW